jgi:hypothetical protein
MTDRDMAERNEILSRLTASREELRHVLDPVRQGSDDGADRPEGQARGGFPRSRTMQTLMSGRGLGTLGAVAGGLLLARPSLALRLLRMVPLGAIAQALLPRVMNAFRSKKAAP